MVEQFAKCMGFYPADYCERCIRLVRCNADEDAPRMVEKAETGKGLKCLKFKEVRIL